jgi:hypothetical protein
MTAAGLEIKLPGIEQGAVLHLRIRPQLNFYNLNRTIPDSSHSPKSDMQGGLCFDQDALRMLKFDTAEQHCLLTTLECFSAQWRTTRRSARCRANDIGTEVRTCALPHLAAEIFLVLILWVW